MPRTSTFLAMGVAFTLGMVLGLVIHLPASALREAADGGGGGQLRVNKRSVLEERNDVFKANSGGLSGSYSGPSNRARDVLFVRHINSDSVENKVNTRHNGGLKRKTNSKQSLVTSKQIWRIKQAQIATLNSFDKGSRTEQAVDGKGSRRTPEQIRVQKHRRKSNVGDFTGVESRRNIAEEKLDALRQLTKDERDDGQIADQVLDHNDVNTDFNMADLSSMRFTSVGDIVDGVFWSPLIESRLPNVTDRIGDEWSGFARTSKIVKMEEGCGRMQNRLVTFQDSTKACARYRINTDQIQGDFFSFLLSLLLGLDNVPKSVLSKAHIKDTQWRPVSSDILGAQWNEEKLMVLSQFVPELTSVFIPHEFRDKQSSLFPSENLKSRTFGELYELAQWSDLIIFDYLTGNLDRVVNNMFNQQWNKRMMEGPVHNLEKTSSEGKLIFLDNESGLFHSYRLLDNYQHFHEQLLNSLCIFRRQTIDALRTLRGDKNLGKTFMDLLKQREPSLHKYLPKIPQHNINVLQERMQHVLDHVLVCEAKYGF